MNLKFYHLAHDELKTIIALASPFDWSCYWRTINENACQ